MRTARASIPSRSTEPGAPSPEGFLPLSEPLLTGNEWKYVKECLDSGWISSVGSFVDRFEQSVASCLGVSRAVAAVNGTAALHAALLACGVKSGDEVLVSDLSFVAPANAIRYCQAAPVFMDADPQTWQIDARKLDLFFQEECEIKAGECFNRRSGRRVKAVLPVHILGLACDMEAIMEVSRRHHVPVVEDACEAIGVRCHGQAAGSFGEAGVLSFNGNKMITAGGGGMVATSSQALADYVRYLTTQAKDDPVEYVHSEIGYNYRLTNVQAALGLAQMEQMEPFLEKKKATALAYEKGLGDLPGIVLMPRPVYCEPSFWLYTILLPDNTALEERKAFIRRLNEAGIGARPLWHPLHGLEPYCGFQAYNVEETLRLYRRAVSLPSSLKMTPQDQERCIQTIRSLWGGNNGLEGV